MAGGQVDRLAGWPKHSDAFIGAYLQTYAAGAEIPAVTLIVQASLCAQSPTVSQCEALLRGETPHTAKFPTEAFAAKIFQVLIVWGIH